MRHAKPTVQLNVRVEPEAHAALVEIATIKDISLRAVVAAAFAAYIESEREEIPA